MKKGIFIILLFSLFFSCSETNKARAQCLISINDLIVLKNDKQENVGIFLKERGFIAADASWLNLEPGYSGYKWDSARNPGYFLILVEDSNNQLEMRDTFIYYNHLSEKCNQKMISDLIDMGFKNKSEFVFYRENRFEYIRIEKSDIGFTVHL